MEGNFWKNPEDVLLRQTGWLADATATFATFATSAIFDLWAEVLGRVLTRKTMLRSRVSYKNSA